MFFQGKTERTLAPTYREFLLTVNGCAKLGFAHGGLLPVNEIAWFYDTNPEWVDAYTDVDIEDITAEEHLEHADDSVRFRRAYLPHLLQIGDVYDGSVYLLNPQVKNAAGEWEAWTFANWYPGASRKPSFADLVTSAHTEVLRELHLKNVPVDEEAVLEKALPILREQIAQGESPNVAVGKYLVSASKSDEMFAAWMRTKQPYYALLEALGYKS